MLGFLTRLRPLLATQAPCRVAQSVLYSRHISSRPPKNEKTRSRAATDYWKDEPRLVSTDKYPLSHELAALGPRHDPLLGNTKTARLQTQIVSPDLCDDVLKYIGPSLEKYKGCDIIDVNPGACLWSQKLHEFLQPRTHVLFDAAPDLWSAYQRPLLDKPGSKYRLYQGNMKDRDAFEGVFDTILAHQKPVEPQSSEPLQPNTNLLVTGSPMWDPKAPGMGFDSLGKQLLYLFTECAWRNERFHKYGPARMLLWTTEQDFKGAVPRSHYNYTKFSMVLNYMAKTVQVVTPSHVPKLAGHGTIGRLPQYEIQSVIRAMQRGRENGLELPQHRRDCIHEMAEDIMQRNKEQGKAADALISQPDLSAYFEERVRAGKSNDGVDFQRDISYIVQQQEMEKHPELRWTVDAKGQRQFTVEGRKRDRQYTALRSIRKNRIKLEELAERYESMFDRELEVLKMEEGPEKEEAKKELEALDEELEICLTGMASVHRTGAVSSADDRISLKSPVPRLQWDHRPYEPLVMQPDEVWPKQRVALLDVEPHPRKDFKLDWFLDFAYTLFSSSSKSVLKALESMHPGAASLVDQVPSFRDPARGGRLNLKHLKVSMLTNEMIEDLWHAYNAWPFKQASANHSKYFQLRGRGRSVR